MLFLVYFAKAYEKHNTFLRYLHTSKIPIYNDWKIYHFGQRRFQCYKNFHPQIYCYRLEI